MYCTATGTQAQDFLSSIMNDRLYLKSMTCSLATIAFSSVFLGLCIGIPVVSAMTTFQSMPSLSGKSLGKLKRFDRIRQSST